MSTSRFTLFALLWVSGFGLRTTILAVPPVIPQIKADLALSGTQVGILSGLPVVFFAIAAVPGALLIARMGAERTLIAGLLLTAVAAMLRGVVPGAGPLFLATAVMGAGVAISQPCAPALVRSWLPDRIARGTAVYTNGMLLGATAPVALTLPLVLPWLSGNWRYDLAVWALPPLTAAILHMALAPRAAERGPAPLVWWPNWRDGTVWRLGVIFVGVNSPFFSINAFLPAYLDEVGRLDLISVGLTALNTLQVPASFVFIAFARRIERRAWPMIGAALIVVFGLIGLVMSTGAWIVFWAGVLGFACGATLIIGLTLPPTLCAPADVPSVSAAMFTIGYGSAMLTSVVGGMAWDLTGTTRYAFLPVALSTLPLMAAVRTLRFPRA